MIDDLATPQAAALDPVLVEGWRLVAGSGLPAMLVRGPAERARVDWVSRSLADLLTSATEDLVGRTLCDLTEYQGEQDGHDGWLDAIRVLLEVGHGRRTATIRSATGTACQAAIEATRLSEVADPAWLVTLRPQSTATDEQSLALQEANARFTALAESAPIGIFCSEVGLRLGYVNSFFVEMCQASSPRLLGMEWFDLIDGQDLPALCGALEHVLKGSPREISIRLREQQDDGPRWLSLRLAPIVTPSRAAGFIGVAEDVTMRRAWEDRLTYQAHHDALTGLVNRRRLVEVVGEKLHSRRQQDRRFALMFVDLDGFKAINDTYGHEMGDRVLVEIARRLRQVARDRDIVSRIAGDEFVVVLADVGDYLEAQRAAARQLSSLEAPIRIGALTESLSASIGVAIPAPNDTVETLMRTADLLMYQAKRSGGARFVMPPEPECPGHRPMSASAAESEDQPQILIPRTSQEWTDEASDE